jgi:hypothetical protein
MQARDSFKENFVYLCTFPNISDVGILITVFNLATIKAIFFNVLILVVAVLRQT